MLAIYSGELIKEYRISRGITLEQLSQGLCNPATLQRIEKGKRTPSIFVFIKIVERLGFEARRFYFSGHGRAEMDFLNVYYEADALVANEKLDEATAKIAELEILERNLHKSDGAKLRRQMVYVLKCGMAQLRGEDISNHIKTIKEALALTLPGYDELSISELLLTYDEIALLNMLATAYRKLGEIDRGINIYYQIKRSMDRFYLDKQEKSRGYIMTLYNLSSALGYEKRHVEALETCNIAIEFCVEQKRLNLLPHLKFNKACALFYLGEREGYKELAIEAIYALKNNEYFHDAAIREEFAKNEMKIILPF